MGKIGDLWVTLGLKKTDFDRGMDSAKKKGVDALKGIAGAAGVAFGAMEAFNRMVTSNEANNDKWENSIRAMNNAVSEFFSALTSGDFSLFTDGLDSIIQKARDTADALRQIEDTQTMFGYFGGKNDLEFSRQLNILRDKTLSDEDRAAAKKRAEDIISEQEGLVSTYRDRADNAVANMIAQRSDISKDEVNKRDVEHMMGVIMDASFEAQDEAYTAAYDEYKKRIRDLQKLLSGAESRYRLTGATSAALDIDKYQQQIEDLRDEYFDARLYNAIWNKTSGDDLKKIVGLYQGSDSLERAIEAMRSRLLRYSSLDTEDITVDDSPEGSIAWYKAEISRLQTELEKATDQGVRVAAQRTINEYQEQIEHLQSQVSRALRDEWVSIGAVEAPEMPGAQTSVGGLAMPEDNTADLTSGMEDYTASVYDATDAIGVLGGAMANITGLVDSGASSWLQYGANIMQAIAQAIPAISSLTQAKNAEATANTSALATGAGSSVASIPIVGPVMAIAAIASVLAAIANLPKFATGGVVGGNSYYGDRILARLNSGEMVLNQSQQASLSNMIDRPTQDIRLTGQFGISGRDLSLTIDKYQKYSRQ